MPRFDEFDEIVLFGPNGNRISSSTDQRNTYGSFLTQILFSVMGGVRYDFGSAHYLFDVPDYFPEDQLSNLIEKTQAFHTGRTLSAKEKASLKPFNQVIAEKLTEETSLDLTRYNIHSIHGSTREAIDLTLSSLSGWRGRRKIAVPLPNWHFNQIAEDAEKRYHFTYFEALDEEQLVNGFKKAAKEDKVKILILAIPAVPLMYNLTASAAKEIDTIALEYGVDIVVDDILRGVQPLGQRESIGSYFTRPYIIEGYSKRFGDNFGGAISYILQPTDGKKIDKACTIEDCTLITALGLEMAFKYATEPALDELKKRNQAFDEGLAINAPQETILTRPSATHLTTLIKLPDSFQEDIEYFQRTLIDKSIDISIMDDFYPRGITVNQSIENMLRITIGRMETRDIYNGARILGREIKRYCQ